MNHKIRNIRGVLDTTLGRKTVLPPELEDELANCHVAMKKGVFG
jgi:hypothetical protein